MATLLKNLGSTKVWDFGFGLEFGLGPKQNVSAISAIPDLGSIAWDEIMEN